MNLKIVEPGEQFAKLCFALNLLCMQLLFSRPCILGKFDTDIDHIIKKASIVELAIYLRNNLATCHSIFAIMVYNKTKNFCSTSLCYVGKQEIKCMTYDLYTFF